MTERKYEPLEKLLDDSGYKYGVIAKRMGISTSYLYRLRTNLRSIDVGKMVDLAEALNVEFTQVSDVFADVKKFYIGT